MTKIDSLDAALQAIWNPKINILLLNLGDTRLELLKDLLIIIDRSGGLLRFPRSGYNLRLLTKISEGFLSCPLLEVNTVKSGTEDEIWEKVHAICICYYGLYGSVDRYAGTRHFIGKEKYYNYQDEKRRRSKLPGLSSMERALGVLKTRELLRTYTQQDAQSYYLEHTLNSNVKEGY